MASPPDKKWVAPDQGRIGKEIGSQSSKTSNRLNQIDRIRANGVGDHIALPQLVVCGDQSAGKSSVLEGISGIPFPRQDGLCTRFATEIILRHDTTDERITATITPHQTRDKEEKSHLNAFRHSIHDFSELPGIVDQAGGLMGVRGSDSQVDGPAFAADVLRLELVGNTGLHLTIVDLPGLISVSENEEDVQLVENLVDSYLEHSRTIILAVVPATSDVDTQGIIQRARHFDKAGLRTVGIITKPDLINAGTESRVAQLANNSDRTKLNLGFFLLKNPSPTDLQAGMTVKERRKRELAFFSTGRWRQQALNPSRIGIDNLRLFLQQLLDSHVERELPKVREDVRHLLKEINRELVELGTERKSPSQVRTYLARVSADYYNLVKAGVEGSYGGRDAEFFRVGDDSMFIRLRATIHLENEKFANYMRQRGEKRKVVSDDCQVAMEGEDDQMLVTAEEMSDWIQQIYHQTRGQELPGNYSQALLGELFHVHSSRWARVAQKHIHATATIVSRFADSALGYVIKDSTVRQNLLCSVTTALEENKRAAYDELERLLQDEARQPITYNHYYTDNIQKTRNDRAKRRLQKSMQNAIHEDWNGRFHFQNSADEISRLVTSLQERVIVDMNEQACSDARTDFVAYYKVARKTFVDNVCRQVIERHVLATLTDGFNPVIVSSYTDEELLSLAMESSQVGCRRYEARQLQAALEQTLRDLAE